jgi:hypothetical protein
VNETLEPPAQPLDVRSAAGVELTPETDVEAGPADDISHEGVACHEPTARQSGCEGTHVEMVACTPSSLREIAFENQLETSPAMTFGRAVLARKRLPSRKLAQQLEQREIGPWGRLEAMSLRLGNDDGSARDGRPQRWLELAEGGFRLTIPLR